MARAAVLPLAWQRQEIRLLGTAICCVVLAIAFGSCEREPAPRLNESIATAAPISTPIDAPRLNLEACTIQGRASASPERWEIDSESTRLHLAVLNGTLENVIEEIAQGADVNAEVDLVGTNGFRIPDATSLHLASVANPDPTVILALLVAGASLEAKDLYGGTPLQRAAKHNRNPAVVQALLDAGADTEAWEYGDYTPLHSAAESSNFGAVEALLAAGAIASRH